MGWRQWKVCEVIRRPHKGDMLPNKNLTLGLAFMLVSSATGRLASAQTIYTVKNGDTVGQIATDHGMKIAELAKANGLDNAHKLKLGQKLVIPKVSPSSKQSNSGRTGSGYAVRNGDNDWNIATRYDIKPSQLRAANPDVNWKNLKIGTRLSIPGTTRSSVATRQSAPQTVTVAGKYTVRDGDNDWTIASRLGTTPKKIRLANPGINWTRIRPGDTLSIPSSAGQIVAAGKVTGSKNINSRYAVVTGNSVIVRRAASTESSRITLVGQGTKVRVLARSGDWYQLRFPMGTEGWVRGDLLAASKPPRIADVVRRHRSLAASTSSSKKVARGRRSGRSSRPTYSNPSLVAAEPTTVVARAQTWRGTRYRYGAMSRSATDCSGFTGQVYRSVGVRLPRTSREQATVGQRVSRSSLKPGDLVFFRTSHGNRISHVGIYQGNGKFIHASNPRGGVTVSNLTDGYYANRFVTARRVAKVPTNRKTSTRRVAKAPKKDTFPDSVPPISVTDSR